MMLIEENETKWKEGKKGSSFDDAFEELGFNGEFINAREIKETVTSPIDKTKEDTPEKNKETTND